jgi:hypothetical protein
LAAHRGVIATKRRQPADLQQRVIAFGTVHGAGDVDRPARSTPQPDGGGAVEML